MSTEAQLRDLLTALYAAFPTGGSAWQQYLSPGVLVVGTDEHEWWDYDAVVQTGRAELELHLNAGTRVEGGQPWISHYGDVWVAVDRPTLHTADGQVIPQRLTVVAVPDGPGLRIEHLHISIGARADRTT